MAPSNTARPLPHFLRQSKSEIQDKFVDLEWRQRERLSEGIRGLHLYPTSTTLSAAQKQNISRWARHTGEDVTARNRYLNVDPFGGNRIHLKVPPGHSDYINASPIKIPPYNTSKSRGQMQSIGEGARCGDAEREHYYIATQGPKQDSRSHIWRMIWSETEESPQPAVIIMLTQTHESGKEKCFQYFPSSLDSKTMNIDEDDEFDDHFLANLELVDVKEDEASRSTVRTMDLKTTNGQVRTIHHLLFSGWPDFLVPEGSDKQALLHLIALSKTLNNNSATNPRIVHCSAGVGRSGTFIALDWLLDELEGGAFDSLAEDDDPIAETVDSLRQQRMMMVQGESQFHFLYEVLREKFAERAERVSREQNSASTDGSSVGSSVSPATSSSATSKEKSPVADGEKEKDKSFSQVLKDGAHSLSRRL